MAEDNSSSGQDDSLEDVRMILRRGDRGRLKTTKSSSSVRLPSENDSEEEPCGSQTTSSSDVTSALSDKDPEDIRSYEDVEVGDIRGFGVVVITMIQCIN
jgi:hypothetical protein